MRRLKAYKKTVSIVNESAIELYKGLGNFPISFAAAYMIQKVF